LREQLMRLVPELERDLRASLRQSFELELADVDEVHGDGLFDGLTQPFAILRFDIKGEVGWVAWDIAAAVAAVEVALGMSEVAGVTPRKLATVERTMLKRLLSAPVIRIARELKLEAKNFRVVDIVEELGSWRDGGPHADAQRLAIHFSVRGPGGDSVINLYLPGLAGAVAQPKKAQTPAAAPEHLAAVPFEASVRLGSAEIALAELLQLEIGDVIPLGSSTDEPLRLIVEDRVCADVRLGARDGNLMVKIERLRRREREE
jgi:flagellar motor switch protein FliM